MPLGPSPATVKDIRYIHVSERLLFEFWFSCFLSGLQRTTQRFLLRGLNVGMGDSSPPRKRARIQPYGLDTPTANHLTHLFESTPPSDFSDRVPGLDDEIQRVEDPTVSHGGICLEERCATKADEQYDKDDICFGMVGLALIF